MTAADGKAATPPRAGRHGGEEETVKPVKVITFTDVKEARAAFALGQVTYRCLACGQVHRSGTRASKRCRKELWERYEWKVVMPFRPPVRLLHELPLPYAFAEQALFRALALLPRFENEQSFLSTCWPSTRGLTWRRLWERSCTSSRLTRGGLRRKHGRFNGLFGSGLMNFLGRSRHVVW